MLNLITYCCTSFLIHFSNTEKDTMDVWVNGAKTETNVKLCNYITKQLLSSLQLAMYRAQY